MSVSVESYFVGQKVYILVGTGQVSAKRYEVVEVWRYPTTFRYRLDNGYVADHGELRAADDGEPGAIAVPAEAAPAVEPQASTESADDVDGANATDANAGDADAGETTDDGAPDAE